MGLQWRTTEHGALARAGGGSFYSRLGVVRRFATDQLELRLGMGSAWRGDVQERRPNGVWRWRSPASGGLPRGADHRPARVTHGEEGGTAHGPMDAGRPRCACTAAYGDETDMAGRDVARPGVSAHVGRQTLRSSLVQEGFSQNF
jgi:hypothetical protein